MESNQTVKNSFVKHILFLLLSFPFGLCYFILTVIGIALGMGTLVIWIGLPILFATLVMLSGIATIERHMIKNLLGLPVEDSQSQYSERRGFLGRFGDMLCDPFTWTRLVYALFLKLPLGILSFTLVITLLSITLGVICLPLVYLVHLFVNTILLANGITPSSFIIPYIIEVHEQFDLTMFARSLLGVPVGLLLAMLTRYILSGLAFLSGELALVMLGPSEKRQSPVSEPMYVPAQKQMYQAH